MTRRLFPILAMPILLVLVFMHPATSADAEPDAQQAHPAVVEQPTARAGALAAPHDILCDEFLGGATIYCVHGVSGDAVAQMANYANCGTEDSCHWDWIVPGSGPYQGDGMWALRGSNP